MRERKTKKNDIITFRRSEYDEYTKPTTHRIVDELYVDGELRYKTKGDANQFADFPAIDSGDVWGKVVIHIPYVGYISDFVKSPVGLTMVIIVPLGWIIWDEYMKRTRIKDSIKDKFEDPR